jgi:hypothetical protein
MVVLLLLPVATHGAAEYRFYLEKILRQGIKFLVPLKDSPR